MSNWSEGYYLAVLDNQNQYLRQMERDLISYIVIYSFQTQINNICAKNSFGMTSNTAVMKKRMIEVLYKYDVQNNASTVEYWEGYLNGKYDAEKTDINILRNKINEAYNKNKTITVDAVKGMISRTMTDMQNKMLQGSESSKEHYEREGLKLHMQLTNILKEIEKTSYESFKNKIS